MSASQPKQEQVREVSPQYLAEACAATATQVVPSGYKLTEVGIIPEDWDVETLGSLVEIRSGESPSRFQMLTSGVPYFKVEQLNSESVYADATPYFIQTKRVVPAGSVIFPKRGASILLNKIRVLRSDSFMDTNLMTLTCGESLDCMYLYSQLTYKGLDAVADTTSIPQINNKHITPYAIPLPSSIEQTTIAKALSDVDALISEQEKLIAKKQAIKTATMQQLLTGRTRLPQFALRNDGTPKGYKPSELGDIPEDWEVDALDEFVLHLESGVSVNSVNEIDAFSHGKHILKTSCVSSGYFNSLEAKSILPIDVGRSKCNPVKGAIIVSRMNTPALVGEIGFVYEDFPAAYLPDRLWQVRFKADSGLNSRWLAYYLSFPSVSSRIKESATGTSGSMKNISKGSFLSLSILTHSESEQTAIATILSDMDADIQALEQRLTKTRQIKQGMMQELLTGRIRLV